MAKRKPIAPFLTLPDGSAISHPESGWELIREDGKTSIIADGGLFPSWDSALKFSLRRRLTVNADALLEPLGLSKAKCRFALLTRLDTGRGLYSELLDLQEIDASTDVLEIVVSPDSSKLSRDIVLTSTLVLLGVSGRADELAPTSKGTKVWESRWSSKLEGGRARLPMETISFSSGLRGIAGANALFQVVVADYPDLEFEQAVCVYLNADFPHFISALENAEPAATTMFWDGVMRQLVAFGLTSSFTDDADALSPGSVGYQLRTWLRSIFPGQSLSSIAALRVDDPGLFDARIQSWVRAGPLWPGIAK